MADPAQIQRLVDRAVDAFGQVDVLVNNAGINHLESAEAYPLERWRAVLAVQLDAAFLCTQAVGRLMIPRRQGSVINIGSIYGLVGHEGALYAAPQRERVEAPAYAAAKGAIINLTRDFAANWGRYGIRVNAISSGTFGKFDQDDARRQDLTPPEVQARLAARVPLGRLGGPDDLKGAVVLLASDAGAFITGHNLVVDGGWTVW